MVAIKALSIGEVRATNSPGQRKLALRYDYQMHVMGHQAVAQYLEPALGGLVPQNLQIGDAVSVGQKDVLPIVPALGDVMSKAWNDDARDSGHDTGWQESLSGSRNR